MALGACSVSGGPLDAARLRDLGGSFGGTLISGLDVTLWLVTSIKAKEERRSCFMDSNGEFNVSGVGICVVVLHLNDAGEGEGDLRVSKVLSPSASSSSSRAAACVLR